MFPRDEAPDALSLRAHDDEHAYQKLLDAIPEAVMIHGMDGAIVLVNKQAEVLFGYSRAELFGTSVELLLPERFRTCHVQHRAAYMEHPTVRPMGADLDLCALRKDGTEFPVEISLSPTALGGEQLVISTVRDVTQRKHADAERQQLYEAAQEAVRVRNVFLSAISHDLGNPVAAIRIYSKRLRELGAVAANEREIFEGLEQIEAGAERMWKLIEELLDLARLQVGRELELNCQKVELVAMVRALVGAQQATSEQHLLRLEAEASTVLGEWDSSRLQRVIYNLLSNAIKYSPEGGEIVVCVAKETDVHRRGGWAVVEVRDQGLGIPADDLPRVLERFHRAANVGHIAGTGIGLASAKQIVEQHGGTLTVESQEGKGTCVTVRLPLEDEDSAPAMS